MEAVIKITLTSSKNILIIKKKKQFINGRAAKADICYFTIEKKRRKQHWYYLKKNIFYEGKKYKNSEMFSLISGQKNSIIFLLQIFFYRNKI